MRPRTLFLGGTLPGYQALRILVELGANIVGVCPTAEASHEIMKYDDKIATFAQQHRLPVFTANISNGELERLIEEIQPHMLFCAGHRRIISGEVLRKVADAVCVHYSLLPRYRGLAPVNWAVVNGEKETGVTFFHLSEELDAGDIIAQERVPIGADDTAWEVLERCTSVMTGLLRQFFPLTETGQAPRTPQVQGEATYCCARTPMDGRIDWSRTSQEIHNLVRGVAWPFPGATTSLQGVPLIIRKTALVENPLPYVGRVPGRVVRLCESGVEVLTGDSTIMVKEVSFPDREETVPARTVVKSVRVTFGS